eukprot:1136136-Pelagomonas_calceolata.AAC.3
MTAASVRAGMSAGISARRVAMLSHQTAFYSLAFIGYSQLAMSNLAALTIFEQEANQPQGLHAKLDWAKL